MYDPIVLSTKLLSAKEVAAMLHCDIVTVRRHAERGTLPCLGKLPGRTGAFVFAATEIEAVRAAGWPCVAVVPSDLEAVSA